MSRLKERKEQELQGFTLVEMLGVMFILALVMGIAVTVVRGSGEGRQREEAARQVAASLQHARTEAITYGGATALALWQEAPDGPRYMICRVSETDEQPVFTEQLGRWRELPAGVVFSGPQGDLNLLAALETQLEVPVPELGTRQLPAIVFGSGGEVVSPANRAQWVLWLASGQVVDGQVEIRSGQGGNGNDVARVMLRRATGRARRLE